ncbi:hypothetical protein P154DRAFT_500294 [Amniculicola lignicola CBS 123094]|uniref:Carbohydrate-binding-like protein n=1 Tax=Amniculicola lignicola CBS 123094 TaxID=1392246 RepID=A0A6A5W2H1_9PLEO|nr:hypothetical protein P154DRAFT_500294 [Amniculicola lignicola CBS 123094]
MPSVLLIAALAGLAVAAPQNINAAAVSGLVTPTLLGPDVAELTPTPIAYNPTSAARAAAAEVTANPVTPKKRSVVNLGAASPLNGAIGKRDACDPQPNGIGPVPGKGAVAEYLDPYNALSQAAQDAATPKGYTKAFTNLQGSTQQIGYLTFKTITSDVYDTQACADFCDNVNYCLGFNIYFERDPSVDPAAACPNPKPVTNIKCSLYGYPVIAKTATNMGQWRGPEDSTGEVFHVVIVGSNGYSKLAPTLSPTKQNNFTGPSTLLPGAINAPYDNGVDTYLGMKLYNNGPYDPFVCASACQAQTAYDRATAGPDGSYKPCNFFNSYILSKNGVPQGTYCSFYTRSWDEGYAVNTGYTFGSDVYTVEASFTYGLTNVDDGQA